MPISNYDSLFGGKGSAQKLMNALIKQYGEKRGESIFYAKVAIKRKGSDGGDKE